MSFDSLPPELLTMICGYSNIPELKSLRATNRALARCIPPKMIFQEVVLYMTRASLGYIENIARNECLAQTVRSLWVQGDYHDHIKNFKEFEAKWNEKCQLDRAMDSIMEDMLKHRGIKVDKFMQAKRALSGKKMPRKQLRNYLREYKRLAKDAALMQEDSTIRHTLRTLFKACPDLDSISYTVQGELRSTTPHRNKQFAEGLLIPCGQPTLYSQGANATAQIIHAAVDAGLSPRELKLGGVSNNVLYDIDLLRRIPDFAKKLEILEWYLCLPTDPYTDRPDEDEEYSMIENFESGCFAHFVNHAHMLRELVIELPVNLTEKWGSPFTISAIVGDSTFPHLTKFHVETMWAVFYELSTFFMRHAETLEDVWLTDWKLENGFWRELFEEIAGKLTRLKHFEVRGEFFDDEFDPIWFGEPGWYYAPTKFGAAVSRFVKGEIDEYPMDPEAEDDMSDDEPFTPLPLDADSDDENTLQDTSLATPPDHQGIIGQVGKEPSGDLSLDSTEPSH